jgi:hypothetical protein
MNSPHVETKQRPRMEPWALGLTIFAGILRLLPHPGNFAPAGAMSLFSGSRLRGWQAYFVPLLLMTATDPLRTAIFHPGFPPFRGETPFIYGSLLISVWIGRRWLQDPNVSRVALAATAGSLQFFLITNAAAWLVEGMYPLTVAGLAACYVAAIPFLANTLASDLLYSGVLFGLYAWSRSVRRRAITVPVVSGKAGA